MKMEQKIKITFGIQPKHLERIEEERQSWGNLLPEKGFVDMLYSTAFWEKMGKEFGWCPFTLALHYFRNKIKSD